MPMILSGTEGGFFPSWTTATRPASPAVGQMGYNTTTANFDQYTAGGWVTTINSSTGKVLTSQMPTGTVLQVVNGTTSSGASTAGTSFVSTPVTASITPTSTTSKIFAIASFEVYAPVAGVKSYTTIFRNGSTNLGGGVMGNLWAGSTTSLQNTITIQVLDSPATTSSTTYTVYVASSSSGTTAYVNNDSLFATITLMEIAA